jgi:hypothetical protein
MWYNDLIGAQCPMQHPAMIQKARWLTKQKLPALVRDALDSRGGGDMA